MDRRTTYRIELGERSTVQVAVLVEGGPLLVGRLHDVSAEGAGVAFPRAAGAPLTVGQRGELVFLGTTIVKPLHVSAVVSHLRAEGEGHLCGFEFTDKEGLDELLIAEDLHILFNRRRARRVRPDSAQPIPVVLDGGASGLVLDLSTGGVGILLDAAVASRFAKTDRLSLSFRLPGAAEDLRFDGTIRHRSEEAGGVRYGVQFDPARTKRIDEQRALLADYVSRSLRDLLRAGAG